MKPSKTMAVSFAAGIAVRPVRALPAQGVNVQFTERVISTSAGEANSVFATDSDGDGPQGLVNVGAGRNNCNDSFFHKPAVWTSSGANPLSVALVSRPTVYAVSGDCSSPVDSDPVLTTSLTWEYCDSSGDGEVTFFNGLFKQWDNGTTSGYGGGFLGPDLGIEVDTQGDSPSVPDQQVSTLKDIFQCFLATTAGGGARWTPEVCPSRYWRLETTACGFHATSVFRCRLTVLVLGASGKRVRPPPVLSKNGAPVRAPIAA